MGISPRETSNDDNHLESSILLCDVFKLEGAGMWRPMSDSMSFSLNFSKDKMELCENGGHIKLSFLICSISNISRFRDDNEDMEVESVNKEGDELLDNATCVQFSFTKGKSEITEWGINFHSGSDAMECVTQILSLLLKEDIEVLVDCDFLLSMTQDIPGTFSLRIIHKKKHEEHFLALIDGADQMVYLGVISHASLFAYEYPFIRFLGNSPLLTDTVMINLRCPNQKVFSDITSKVKNILPIKGNDTPMESVVIEKNENDSEIHSPSSCGGEEDKERRETEKNESDDEGEGRNAYSIVDMSGVSNRLIDGTKTGLNRAFVWQTKLSSRRKAMLHQVGGGADVQVLNTDTNDAGKVCTIRNVLDKNGNGLCPSQCMLHEADKRMLLLDPDKQNIVYSMDMNRGEVAEEWSTGHLNIDRVIPMTRDSQKTTNRCFLGFNSSSVFIMDPRAPKVVVDDDYIGVRTRRGRQERDEKPKDGDTMNVRGGTYSYSTSVGMTSAACDSFGRFVTGGRRGQLRLFDGQLNKEGQMKRCKTLLEGTGDPIDYVDVTEDGMYVVATTSTYLTLFGTCIEDKISTKVTAFDKSVPKDKNCFLFNFGISHTDINSILCYCKEVKFTEARFSYNNEMKASGVTGERAISVVCTVGNWIVTWKLEDLLKHNCRDYNKRKLGERAIATISCEETESIVAMYKKNVEICSIRKRK